MLIFTLIITGFAGFLLGIIVSDSKPGKKAQKPQVKKCRGDKNCVIANGYGDFFMYDGSEKA